MADLMLTPAVVVVEASGDQGMCRRQFGGDLWHHRSFRISLYDRNAQAPARRVQMSDVDSLAAILETKLGAPRPIDELMRLLGEPVSRLIMQQGGPAVAHDTHASGPDRYEQFLLHVKYAVPETVIPQLRNAAEGLSPGYYLALIASRRDGREDVPPHIRWGIGIEAGKDRYPKAAGAYRTIAKRMPGGGAGLVIPDMRRVMGIRKDWWLSFFGRLITVTQLRAETDLSRIHALAAAELSDLYRAMNQAFAPPAP